MQQAALKGRRAASGTRPLPHPLSWLRVGVALGLAGLVAIGATACGSAPVPSSTLSDWQPPPGQRCMLALGDWEALPPMAQLADSLALVQAAAQWLEGSGHAVYSIRFDSAGTPASAHAVESSLGAEATAELGERVRAAFLPRAEGAPRYLRVRVEADGVVEARLGASQECMPALRNREEVSRLLEGVARRLGISGTARLWIFVATTGEALETRVDTTSGDPLLDEHMRTVGMQMRFHPALADRVPVAVWVALPLTVRR